MREVPVNSAQVAVAARDFDGPAEALLLLHGAGGNLAAMTVLAEALRSRHRVVTVDLPGHGERGGTMQPRSGHEIVGAVGYPDVR